ncbi:hypothetical protein NPIL_624101 [Nephila pilipes]|uniref:Uncharacterized protein n=1 Tax=Nephila pilipes TaxID=299642 RepID=A0A8X6NEA9_NEPPI|nr:hypothetical protein NPIL_624101 [Nephila pilipes]
MHDYASTDNDAGKPSVILDYNKAKGGVDVVDKLEITYTVSRRALKWHLQKRFIPSLPKSSKNIIKRQFNELEAASPEELAASNNRKKNNRTERKITTQL